MLYNRQTPGLETATSTNAWRALFFPAIAYFQVRNVFWGTTTKNTKAKLVLLDLYYFNSAVNLKK